MSTGIFKTEALRLAGTADMWSSSSIVLENGAIGAELDTGKQKIGDGVSEWSALPYVGAASGSSQNLATVATTGKYSDLIDLPTTFVPPIATASTVGGVIVKNGLTIDAAGNLSANVVSVNGKTGAVTLAVADINGAASTSYVDSAIAAVPTFTKQTAPTVNTWTDTVAQGDFQALITLLVNAGILTQSN